MPPLHDLLSVRHRYPANPGRGQGYALKRRHGTQAPDDEGQRLDIQGRELSRPPKRSSTKELEKIREEVIQRWPSKADKDVIPLDVQGANVLFVSMAEKPSILPAAGTRMPRAKNGRSATSRR